MSESYCIFKLAGTSNIYTPLYIRMYMVKKEHRIYKQTRLDSNLSQSSNELSLSSPSYEMRLILLTLPGCSVDYR